MSDINASTKEVVTSDMKHSPSSRSSSTTSSEEELLIAHSQYTSSMIITSPNIVALQLSTLARTENELDGKNVAILMSTFLLYVLLPYPLRLDKDYTYQIRFKPDEFVHYCQSEQMKLMFDDPMDVIDNFIQNHLKQGLDIGVNEECLNHLNNMGQIYINDEYT